MTKSQPKAEVRTKPIVGQTSGEELPKKGKKPQLDVTDSESVKGGNDQGIVRDERGQEQPRDKERAQHVSRVDRGGDPPGKPA
jgi:hypothetical protein